MIPEEPTTKSNQNNELVIFCFKKVITVNYPKIITVMENLPVQWFDAYYYKKYEWD